LDERRAKKVEAQLKQDGVKVVATVWGSDKNKLTQVSENTSVVFEFLLINDKIGQIRVSGVYELTNGMKNALDDILDKIRSNFEKLFPSAAQLNW
jgi:hypothetical protein